MTRPGLLVLVLALLAPPLPSQEVVAERLSGRTSPQITALVQELAGAAASRGLPLDPLIQKAIEGSAKAIPDDRVATALRLVAAQLDTAAVALQSAGPGSHPDTTAIAAGGFAVSAGLRGRDIAELARTGQPMSDVIVGMRVAGTLSAMGVPPDEAVKLVSASLRAHQTAGDLLSIPGRVQTEMARGATPAQAAAGLARAAAAQARHGPPPDHGPPTRPNSPRP